MAQLWRQVRLAEVCNFQNGFAFKNSDYVEEGNGAFEIFRMGNISRGGGFNPDGKKAFVSKEQGKRLERFLLNEGDILMCMTDMKSSMALLGHTAWMPITGCYLLNQRVGRITVSKPDLLERRFLYYHSNSPDYVDWLRAHANSGVQVNLSTDAILNSPVPLPPLPIQRRIAGILSAYDELIENSQRRIKILESMASALYREWFIHFRFPGHESVPRVPSPLGEIPQGWVVKKLGEVADTFRGRSYRSVDLADEGGLPFLNLKCLDREGGFRRSGLKRYIGEFKDVHVAKKDDIVMAVTDMTQERRIVARAALVPTLDNDFGVFSMDLVRIEPKSAMPKTFLYSLLRYSSFADEVKQHANGANVLHLAPERITDYRFMAPPTDSMIQFADFAAPIVEEIDMLANRIVNLRRTRDLLMRRLLSGQIDVEAIAS